MNNKCEDLLSETLSKGNIVRRTNNENKKTSGRPLVVANQSPENQKIFARIGTGPGVKAYCKVLAGESNKNDRVIKIFCDSIPKGIRIK